MSWAIGIDFGTSRSAGAIGELDARRLHEDPATGRSIPPIMAPTVSPLEIEGNRWIPSMVLRTPEGQLVVGAAADNLAGVHPDRLERTPKRALGTGAPLLLGEPIDPRDAAAAVIRMVLAEGRLRQGEEPRGAIVTHPVRWAGVRRAALAEAAQRAGLAHVQLVEEPVAAAIHYASEHVQLGSYVGVYDLGGGTFDTALLQRTDGGFEVIGVPGGDENIGGENFDHRLFRYFGQCIADESPDIWAEMMTSDDRKWKRAALDLLVQARRAKEALSSYTSTQVFVPIADRDIVVNRSQFEAMIIDDVERTVDLMEDTVVDGGLQIEDLTAVFLVGGSSRVPLVAQMVTERFGARVVTRDEPKGVVALGAARLAALRYLVPPPGPSQARVPTSGPGAPPGGAPPERAQRSGDARPHEVSATIASLPSPMAPPGAPPPARGGAGAPPGSVAPGRAGAGGLGAGLAPPVISGPTAGALAPPATITTPPVPAPPAPVTVAWRLQVGETPGQLAADARDVVFGAPSGMVRCVDPQRGTLRWEQRLRAPTWSAPALTDELVVVGSSDGRMVILDRASGAVRWQIPIGHPIACTPVVVGGVVVVGNDGGRVLGIELASGAVRWDLPVGSALRGGFVAVGREVVVATTAGQVYAVDSQTGRPRWGYRTAGQVLLAPGVSGDRVIVPSRDGIVHVLRLSDGVAEYGIRCNGAPATPIAVGGEVFGVVDEAGVARIHRADTGRAVLEAPVATAPAAGLVLVPGSGPTIAVIETGGQLVAVDLVTRTPRFAVPTGEGNREVPVVSGDLVCVGTTFGQLYGIVAP